LDEEEAITTTKDLGEAMEKLQFLGNVTTIGNTMKCLHSFLLNPQNK
jgi:hypothetical protein